ncbi:hypothetical protein HDV05_001431, partial [Chytridiales sp. JEL 0842]
MFLNIALITILNLSTLSLAQTALTVSPSPSTIAISETAPCYKQGTIKAVSKTSNQTYTLTNLKFGEHQLSFQDAVMVKIPHRVPPPFSISYVNPQFSTFPFLGAIFRPGSEGVTGILGTDSHTYVVFGSTSYSAPGGSHNNLDNSWSATVGGSALTQSSIWSLNQSTGLLKIYWTNPDGSVAEFEEINQTAGTPMATKDVHFRDRGEVVRL